MQTFSRLSINQYTVRNWSISRLLEGCAAEKIPFVALWRDKVAEIGLGETVKLIGLLRGGQLQVSERLQESELRSQELQELQNARARSLSENPGPASPWENPRQAPRFSSS